MLTIELVLKAAFVIVALLWIAELICEGAE